MSISRSQYRLDLLRALVLRDIKLRYKGSVLGIAWGLVTPLAQLLVFVIVFHGVVRLRVPHYATFVFTGLLAWNWFQSSIYAAATSLIDGRGLVRRPGFPPAVLPAVTVATNLIHYLLGLPVLVGFMLFDGVRITPFVLALPVLLVVQFAFTLGLAYLLAISQVLFRDTQQLLTLALMLCFYLTPIFYDSSAVPQNYLWLYGINPFVYLLDAHRAVLLRGELPNLIPVLVLAVASGGLLLLGYRAFIRASHRLAEEL